MKLHQLKPAKGSVHKNVRKGRGQGSGKGGTSTRGHNGQKSRSGYSKKIGFEGGQMPLQRRLPKFGFKNPTRKEYIILNLSDLQARVDSGFFTTDSPLTLDVLRDKKVIKGKQLIKILGDGELTSAISIEAHKFSASAKKEIEAKGGTATQVKPFLPKKEKEDTDTEQ